MLLGDGDGFVRCACGHWHWGLYGAAGLLLFDQERGVLLQRRAWWTHHGRTWALPGGAVRSDETPAQAAIREASEEAAVPRESLRLVSASTEEHDTWRYTTVLARALPELRTRAVSSESAELRWVGPAQVEQLPLHRDFAAAWPALAGQLGRAFVLVVDATAVLDGSVDVPAVVALRERLEELALLPLGAHELGPAPPGGHLAGWSWWSRPVLLVPEKVGDVDSGEAVEVVSGRAEAEWVMVTARRVRGQPGRDHVVVVTDTRGGRSQPDTDDVATADPRTLRSLLARHTTGGSAGPPTPVHRCPGRTLPEGPV